jgi:hypothetical protein
VGISQQHVFFKKYEIYNIYYLLNSLFLPPPRMGKQFPSFEMGRTYLWWTPVISIVMTSIYKQQTQEKFAFLYIYVPS